jgi:GTP diphosphokinase / guanosine-3',5'-bis(diphosphate) 3'-diphosphatase
MYRGRRWQTGFVAADSDSEHQLSFTRDLPLTQEAVSFARERHAGQTRDADQASLVIHPLEAASALERSRYPDYVVAAAVLHDVLEDTDTERAELEDRFGPEVAELVTVLSDDPLISDEDERREAVRERVRRAGGYAPVVYAADKVSKVRELRALIAGGLGADEAESKRRHYAKCLAMLEEVIPANRLVEVLRFELEALTELPPGSGEHG